jgi:hypothetical protein
MRFSDKNKAPGRLVTKAEIQEAVWKDTFVTENALTRPVAQIRKGLGDDARDARYIETVPTRGYRFVASLEPGRNGSRPAAAIVEAGLDARPRWSPGRRAAAAGTALLALVLAGLAFRSWSARPSITVVTPVGPASRALGGARLDLAHSRARRRGPPADLIRVESDLVAGRVSDRLSKPALGGLRGEHLGGRGGLDALARAFGRR